MDCFPLIPPEDTPDEIKEKMRKELLVATAAAMELHEKTEEQKTADGEDESVAKAQEAAQEVELKQDVGEGKQVEVKRVLSDYEVWMLLMRME